MKRLPCCLLITIVQAASAQTWTPTTAPSLDWRSVASSADGSHLLAGGTSALYTSTNSGANWTSNNVAIHDWSCVASSADASVLAAAIGYPDTGGIYFSTNGGVNWNPSAAPSKQWISLAMSADGTKVMALPAGGGPGGGAGLLLMSTNSGMIWTTNTTLPPTNFITAVASSVNGNQCTVARGPAIFVSTDTGNSWASNYVSTNLPQSSVAVSADGNTFVAGAGGNGGYIYTSTNLGVSWTPSNVKAVWYSAAASADGSLLIGGTYPAIYTSTDSGTTWISNNAPRIQWSAVATSADGHALVAAGLPGGIYTLQTTPSPSLNISAATSNCVAVSWLIPSTNFVLQQSSDLLNWSTVTNATTLNLTNLQNQVVIPISGGSTFYRLATP